MTEEDPMDGGPWGQPFNTAPDEPEAKPGARVRIGMRVEDFINSTETKRWSVDGLVIESGITVLGGDPESFKSTGAHNIAMAYSRAWPGEWLGQPVDEGPVIYISNEKAKSAIADRFRSMMGGVDDEGTPDQPPKYDFYVIHNKVRVSRTTDPGMEPWSSVVSMVRDLSAFYGGRSVLVILDTLNSCGPRGYDENDNMAVNDYLSNLKEVRDAGATILLIHHYSKAGSASGGGSMGLRGGTALAGDIDGSGLFVRTDPERPIGEVRLWPKEGERKKIAFTVDAGNTFAMNIRDGIKIVTFNQSMVVEAVKHGAVREADIIAAIRPKVPNVTQREVRDALRAAVAAGLLSKARANAPFAYVGGVVDDEVGHVTDDDDNGPVVDSHDTTTRTHDSDG